MGTQAALTLSLLVWHVKLTGVLAAPRDVFFMLFLQKPNVWFVHLQTSFSCYSFLGTWAAESPFSQEVQITVRDFQHLWPISCETDGVLNGFERPSDLCTFPWCVQVNGTPISCGFSGVISEIWAGNAQCSQHLLFRLLSGSSLRFLPG